MIINHSINLYHKSLIIYSQINQLLSEMKKGFQLYYFALFRIVTSQWVRKNGILSNCSHNFQEN